MITEQSIIDSINVLQDGQIEIRRVDVVLKDGVEIAKTYHRHCLNPGDDLNAEEPRVASVAQAVWTPEVVTTWESKAPVTFVESL
jgi:urease accessory protein UreE